MAERLTAKPAGAGPACTQRAAPRQEEPRCCRGLPGRHATQEAPSPTECQKHNCSFKMGSRKRGASCLRPQKGVQSHKRQERTAAERKPVWNLFRNYALSALVFNAFSESRHLIVRRPQYSHHTKTKVGRDILLDKRCQGGGRDRG